MPENELIFEGNPFTGSAYINTQGDTIRSIYTHKAKPNQLYSIQMVNKKGADKPQLITQKESGEFAAGQKTYISPTSSWGKTILGQTEGYLRSLPITEDRSKYTGLKKFLYSLFEKQGGLLKHISGN